MRVNHLDDMVKGWFVGDFDPVVMRTSQFEVGVKKYKKNDYESRHYHKIATEMTVIITGEVVMNGIAYDAGKIIVIEPGDETDFRAITDAVTVVVKVPSVLNDKYIAGK